jgi:hypothetical protein
MPPGHPVGGRIMATRDFVDHDRLLLLEEGHCLRDQALSFCSTGRSSGDTLLQRQRSQRSPMEHINDRRGQSVG